MQKNNLFQATGSGGPHLQSQPNLPRRILVVDHDPYACHLVADVLIRHGFEVNAAEDGAAGWAELQVNHYNLLITEQDLPKISGVKLVRKVRVARLALPVVMIALKLPTHELVRSPSLQLAATLLKPLPVAALLDTVKIILRATNSPREQSMPPPFSQNQSSANGWQPKLIAAAAITTTRVLQEINESYHAYAHWGLNE